jgi:magnesium chelatase family protein
MKAHSAKVASCTLRGLTAPATTVTVYYLPEVRDLQFSIVHASEAQSRQIHLRLMNACIAQQVRYPNGCYFVLIQNAELLNEGHFDLPILIAMLIASGELPKDCLRERVLCGGIKDDGKLEPIYGLLPILTTLANSNQTLIVPRSQQGMCEMVANASTSTAQTVQEVIGLLRAPSPPVFLYTEAVRAHPELYHVHLPGVPRHLLRALVVAAVGGHSLLVSGKEEQALARELAHALHALLPPLEGQAAFELAANRSLHQGVHSLRATYGERPFLNLTPLDVADLLRPSKPWIPGPLASNHQGVVLFDNPQLADRQLLDLLLTTAHEQQLQAPGTQLYFPAAFQVVCALPPCPCGEMYTRADGSCGCNVVQKEQYRLRLASLYALCHLQLLPQYLPVQATRKGVHNFNVTELRALIIRARERALKRAPRLNAQLAYDPEYVFPVHEEARELWENLIAGQRLDVTERQVLGALALTLADLDACNEIRHAHLSEALLLHGHIV